MLGLFLKILFALPVYQSIILSIFLFSSNQSKPSFSRKIMGIFQLLMAYYFSFNLLYSLQLYNWLIVAYYFILPVILMFVPVFYLYMLSVTTPGFKFQKKHIYHFVPTAMVALLNIPYLISEKSIKYQFITHSYHISNQGNLFRYFLWVYAIGLLGIFSIQLIYYSLEAYKLYRNHKKYIENRYSFTENINLDWLLSLIICFVIFFTFNGILYLIGFRQSNYIQILYILSMLITTLYIGYRGMLQLDLKNEDTISGINSLQAKDVNHKIKLLDTPIITNEVPILISNSYDDTTLARHESVKKYSGSTLTETQKNALLKKLLYLMENEKYYINEKLSLEDVAIKLDSNTKYISQIINETYNKNFYNFINTYRIEEAKKLLASSENDKFSILGIAQTVGFLSKSSFNAAFKRYTGLTPTEFKASMLDQ